MIALIAAGLCFGAGSDLEAQSSRLLVLGGANEPVNDELGLDADLDVFEVAYAKRMENQTWFQVRLGEVDLAGERFDEGREPEIDTEVRYALAIVEYEFDEIFGSTSLFAGLGAYDISGIGREDDEDWGFALGVAIDLPVSRRVGIVAEAAYHDASFDDQLRMLNVTAGLRFSF